MAYLKSELRAIYDRTSGKCHICAKKLSFANYGRHGERASWHVEHSVPKANGGTDHKNNLYAACIGCNLEKSDGSTRSARARRERTRAPLSKEAREELRSDRALSGAGLGGLVGWVVAPELMVAGIIAGALVGYAMDTD